MDLGEEAGDGDQVGLLGDKLFIYLNLSAGGKQSFLYFFVM